MNENARSGQRKLSVEDWKKARKLYESGKTYAAVAGEFKASPSTIFNRAKKDRWRLKDRSEIVRKASEKARVRVMEKAEKTVEQWTKDLLDRGAILHDLMIGEITARANALRTVKDAAGNVVRGGEGDASEYRAIVAAYKDLVQTLRLQLGLTTANVKADVETTMGAFEDQVKALRAEREAEAEKIRKGYERK